MLWACMWRVHVEVVCVLRVTGLVRYPVSELLWPEAQRVTWSGLDTLKLAP